MLEQFAAWLGKTPLSAFVADQGWAVPAIQTIHILAISVLMGSVAIVNLRILGLVERNQSIRALAVRFVPPSVVAIAVLALTGFLLIASEPNRAIFRYVFWAKMSLLLIVVGLTGRLLAGLRRAGVYDQAQARAPIGLRMVSVISLLVWLGVIVTGRWIGYSEGWPGSPS